MQQNLRDRILSAFANSTPVSMPADIALPLQKGETKVGKPLSLAVQGLFRLKDEVYEGYRAAERDKDEAGVRVLGGQYQMLESLFWAVAVEEAGYSASEAITIRNDWQMVKLTPPKVQVHDLGGGVSILVLTGKRPQNDPQDI